MCARWVSPVTVQPVGSKACKSPLHRRPALDTSTPCASLSRPDILRHLALPQPERLASPCSSAHRFESKPREKSSIVWVCWVRMRLYSTVQPREDQHKLPFVPFNVLLPRSLCPPAEQNAIQRSDGRSLPTVQCACVPALPPTQQKPHPKKKGKRKKKEEGARCRHQQHSTAQHNTERQHVQWMRAALYRERCCQQCRYRHRRSMVYKVWLLVKQVGVTYVTSSSTTIAGSSMSIALMRSDGSSRTRRRSRSRRPPLPMEVIPEH